VSGSVVRASIVVGSLLGAISVALGAFGAHGLKGVLEASGQAGNWETASRYALVHALALVVTGLVAALPGAATRRLVATAAWCFGLGTVVFSGCLWLLAATGIRRLGAVVPVGGGLLIAGWLMLALAAARLAASSRPVGHH